MCNEEDQRLRRKECLPTVLRSCGEHGVLLTGRTTFSKKHAADDKTQKNNGRVSPMPKGARKKKEITLHKFY